MNYQSKESFEKYILNELREYNRLDVCKPSGFIITDHYDLYEARKYDNIIKYIKIKFSKNLISMVSYFILMEKI